jgi:2-oxoglutarate ferredoxin oxidoreductase subunit beta
MKITPIHASDVATQNKPNWCPGCGNYGIWVSLKQAVAQSGYKPHQVVIVGDIGCSGKMSYWTEYSGFASLHGRAIPLAEGIKLGNHKLLVIVVIGDGGALSEGLQHFVHAAKRNADIKVMMHNNQLYGLTKGQTSPTSDVGFKSSMTPEGAYELPLNPLTVALTAHASFVASSFAGDAKHLTATIKEALEHKGFSFVNIFQPCVTYNYLNTYAYYKNKVQPLSARYAPTSRTRAILQSMKIEEGEELPIGVLYKQNRKTLEEEVVGTKNVLAQRNITGISVDNLFDHE